MLLLLCLLLSRPLLSRAAQHVAATLACAALLLAAASMTLFLAGVPAGRELALERQALDTRGIELLTRAALPGSPLACLDGGAGEIVESSCERLLFASPEAIAAAVSYVSAQMALLADYSRVGRQTGVNEPAKVVSLRRAIEADRFGLVAQVLASRDGCTPSRCEAFAFLNDARQVRSNLAGRRFDSYVARYAAAWPTGSTAADTSAQALAAPDPEARMSSLTPSPGTPVAIQDMGPRQPVEPHPTGSLASVGRPLRPEIFLPSAASIPPVSIMSPEPGGPAGAEPGSARTAAGPIGKGAAAPTPKASAAAPQGTAASRKPVRSSEQARSSGDTNVTPSVPLSAAVSQ